MTRVLRALGSLFVLTALVACAPPAPPPGAAGPVEAVQEFSAALQKGDTATAWALLTPRTRAAADEIAAQSRKARGGADPESGRQMLFASALPQGAATATLADEKGDEAHVLSAGRRYRVVRAKDRWLLDLELPAVPSADGGGAR